MEPADNSDILPFGYENRVLRGRPDGPKSLANLRCRRRISELSAEFGNTRRITGLRAANLQFFLFSVHSHFLPLLFHRILSCHAALSLLLSAPAATRAWNASPDCRSSRPSLT